MKETTEKTIKFEELDATSFRLLVEYAYTGRYYADGIPSVSETSVDQSPKPAKLQQGIDPWMEAAPVQTNAACQQCGGKISAGLCSENTCREGSGSRSQCCYCTKCGAKRERKQTDRPEDAKAVFKACEHCLSTSKILPFLARKYPVGEMDHDKFRAHFQFLRPKHSPCKDILSQAKLYVFANMWMIEELKEICLHKLHRDLKYLKLNEPNVLNICDTLRLVYDNTAVAEDSTTSASDIRSLLVDYAACCRKTLMRFASFKELLGEGGDFVVEWSTKVAGGAM